MWRRLCCVGVVKCVRYMSVNACVCRGARQDVWCLYLLLSAILTSALWQGLSMDRKLTISAMLTVQWAIGVYLSVSQILGLQAYEAMTGVLHGCWRFELGPSRLQSKWLLPTELPPQPDAISWWNKRIHHFIFPHVDNFPLSNHKMVSFNGSTVPQSFHMCVPENLSQGKFY